MVPSAVVNEAIVFLTVLAMIALVRRVSLKKLPESFRYFTTLSNLFCALTALLLLLCELFGAMPAWAFIGEGEGGSFLREYEEQNAEDLKEKGLVASYYCDEHKRGFVSQEMIDEIRETVARARFRQIWGKDMPDGLPLE